MPKLNGYLPSNIFFAVIFTFQFLPGLYIYLYDIREDFYGINHGVYSNASLLYLICTLIFLLVFFIARYIILVGGKLSKNYLPKIGKTIEIYSKNRKMLRIPRFFLGLSFIFIFTYFVFGGYEKLMGLGTDIDAKEFRFIGYDDRARILTSALEIARRVLLPVSILYYLLLKKIGINISTIFLISIISLQILASAMTFDRAPFFILVVLFAFSYLSGIHTLKGLVTLVCTSLVVIVVLAGIITNLQYNITDFSPIQAAGMGFDFLIHRAWLIPSITPIELSFSLFDIDSNKLLLKYSRLGALITGNYIGSDNEFSIFVTPVGIIGDIWRNFGFYGIFSMPFLFAYYFRILDDLSNRVSIVSLLIGNFLVIALSFYLVMGVVFSQGLVFTCCICYFFLKYEAKIYRNCFLHLSKHN